MRVLIVGGAGGSGGFIRHLRGITAPGRVPRATKVSILCGPALPAKLGTLDDQVDVTVDVRLVASSTWRRLMWWRSAYPRHLAAISPDVVLFATGVVRGPGGPPSVAVSNNMALFDRALIRSYGLGRMGLQLRRLRLQHILSYRRAAGVLFMSDHSATSVSSQVGGLGAVRAVNYGLEPEFLASEPKTIPLEDPVTILYVSTVFLYKHHWELVHAVAALRRELQRDLRLVLVGGGEPIALARLHAAIRQYGGETFTSLRGDVAAEQMPHVYRSADLFAFPSSVESFGLSLLEAMGAGLPIVSSDRMCLPEVLGDAGVYCSPEDWRSIATALRTLIHDDGIRATCARRARARAEGFTWSVAAMKTYAFLREVAENADRR